MSCKRIVLTAAVILMSLVSCDTLFPDRTAATSTEVFDELWNAVNQKYVCFPNRDVNWDTVYTKYRGQVSDDMDDSQLFSVLCQMLGELNDGHVNLKTDMKEWSGYRIDLVTHVSRLLVSYYLGEDVKIAGGLRYNTIHNGLVGYIEYASFLDDISDDQVYEALAYCKDCQGLILDLRGNRGGAYENVRTLLKFLPLEKELFKSLVRHNDIRDDLKQNGMLLKPTIKDESKIWQKPLIVLIDNRSYSAASIFAASVKGCNKICIVGVKTSGGTSSQVYHELSNGWYFRIPTVKYISRSGIDYENGVPPDIEIQLDVERVKYDSEDNIIEAACEMILSHVEFSKWCQ